MDNSVRVRVPATLELACALEEQGDLFAAAQALLETGLSSNAGFPLAVLLRDMLAPLMEMGAVYADGTGQRKIDRQAVCDFGVVYCGLTRAAVMRELTLHELALHHRRVMGGRDGATALPSAQFMAEMQALFPDQKEEKS